MFRVIILSTILFFTSLFQQILPPPVEVSNCYGPQAEITNFDPTYIPFSIYDKYVVCQVTLFIDGNYVAFPSENKNYSVTGIGTHNVEIIKNCEECSDTEFIWIYIKETQFLYFPMIHR